MSQQDNPRSPDKWKPRLRFNLALQPLPPPRRWPVQAIAICVVIALIAGGAFVFRRFRPATRNVPAVGAPQPSPPAPQTPPVATQSAPVATHPNTPEAGVSGTPSPESAPVPQPEPQPALPATATLSAVRHTSRPDSIKIELELNRPVRVHSALLQNPDRVFFDLPETTIAGGLAASPSGLSFDISDSRVRRVRVGRRDNATRVVLDLNCACAYSENMSPTAPYLLTVTVISPSR